MFKSKKFKDYEIEPEEILLDVISKEKEKEIGISETKKEIPLSEKIFNYFFYFFVFLFVLLFLKAFQLQIIEGKQYSQRAQMNRFIVLKTKAERGVIYDRNFNLLARNKISYDLLLEKEKLLDSKKDEVISKLAQILKVEKEEIKRKIESLTDKKIILAKDLNPQTVILLESEIENFPGFSILENHSREYPEGEYFSHVLGYLGKISSEEYKKESEWYEISDLVGRDGIEKFYEKVLRKKPGIVHIERDAKGKIKKSEIVHLPEHGKSLVLTIDTELQKTIKEILEREIKKLGLKRGAAVVLDINSGEILALVSIPSYDNNVFVNGNEEKIKEILQDKNSPLFNRAISGEYPVGSTIKPLLALAALEEKIITESTVIDDSPGFIKIPHAYKKDVFYTFEDWRVHGPENVKEAIAESCNIFFYTIGGGEKNIKGLGPTKIKNYLSKFGWGKLTNIDLPGEKEGEIPDPEWKKEKLKESWWDGDTYLLSIGQGYLKVTPLQVAVAFSALANGGKIFKPHLVKKIVDDKKNTIEEIKPEIIGEIYFDQKNAKIVLEGMRWSVTGENSPSASAKILFPLPVAAKTGTAEIVEGKYYDVWVTILFPYPNPKFVLVMVVENSPTLSLVILPAAKEILEWYFSKTEM